MKLQKFTVANVLYFLSSSVILLADEAAKTPAGDFKISDANSGLFDSGSKVVAGMHSAEWIIKGSAALFSISCFISAGNSARQGDYGRAAGAVIGGIIAAIGAYLVSLAQR